MLIRRHRPDTGDNNLPDVPRHRREGRGLGPFSGGQLTAIILGIAFAVALPAGAWAIDPSPVYVTDSVTGKTATVNPSGQLAVDGTAGAPVIAANMFVRTRELQNIDTANPVPVVCVRPPAGAALVVTSVGLDLGDDANGRPARADLQVVSPTTTTDCSLTGPLQYYDTRYFTTRGTQEVPFPSGLPIRNGHALRITLSSSNQTSRLLATVKGYVVPTAQSASSPVKPLSSCL